MRTDKTRRRQSFSIDLHLNETNVVGLRYHPYPCASKHYLNALSFPNSAHNLLLFDFTGKGKSMRCSTALSLLALCALTSAITPSPCLAQVDSQTKQLSHDIFQQLIEINTTDSVG